jgi:hypothetical protein
LNHPSCNGSGKAFTLYVEELLEQVQRNKIAAGGVSPSLVRGFVQLIDFSHNVAVPHDFKHQALYVGI